MENIPIYVINLADARDRWSKCSESLKAAGFRNITRIDAVLGKSLSQEELKTVLSTRALYDMERTRYDLRFFATKGPIGCYLSHVSVWQEMLERGDERAIILEDDVVCISKDGVKELVQLLRSCPSDADMAFLNMDSGPKESTAANAPWLRIKGIFHSAAAYLITAHGIEKLIPRMFPIEAHVDVHFGMLAAVHSDVYMYGVKRSIFKPEGSSRMRHNEYNGFFLTNHPGGFTRGLFMASWISICVVGMMYLGYKAVKGHRSSWSSRSSRSSRSSLHS